MVFLLPLRLAVCSVRRSAHHTCPREKLLKPCVFAAAKLKYGTILANVDWLHGSAESFLTVTNLFIGKPQFAIR